MNEMLNTAADWPACPFGLFGEWLDRARAAQVDEPEAMALATSTSTGVPSVRMVLMRGYDEAGFCFYTNYESRKATEMSANPNVAAVFYWHESYMQVRIEGAVEKVSAAESDAYFHSREISKQISAVVSDQSRPLTDWAELEAAAQRLEAAGAPLQRPPHWGGYRIVPQALEFWSGRGDRMHRRCRYTRRDETWDREMLAP